MRRSALLLRAAQAVAALALRVKQQTSSTSYLCRHQPRLLQMGCGITSRAKSPLVGSASSSGVMRPQAPPSAIRGAELLIRSAGEKRLDKA